MRETPLHVVEQGAAARTHPLEIGGDRGRYLGHTLWMAQRVSMVAKYRFGTAPAIRLLPRRLLYSGREEQTLLGEGQAGAAPGSSRSRRRNCSLASSSSPITTTRDLSLEYAVLQPRPPPARLVTE